MLQLFGLLLLLLSLSSAQRPSQLAVYTPDGNVGLLDILSGNLTCLAPVPLPTPSPGCQWTYLSGTPGQTSASFKQNSTYFFTSQQLCTNGTASPVYLWQAFGPRSCQSPASLRLLTALNTPQPVEALNIAWDHTCNVVALVPGEDRALHTRQVSEYDGQDRPRPDYSAGPQGCWAKLDGLAALDFGTQNPDWQPGAELNCGESCVLYTLEECTVGGRPVLPRRLLGKYFRSGALASETEDVVQLQTLSFVPLGWAPGQQFLGVGVCCEESWCHAGCKGLAGEMVLVSFLPGDRSLEVLDGLGAVDDATGRLGVEFSPLYGDEKYVVVYHSGQMITYVPVISGGVIASVKRVAAFDVEQDLAAWFGFGY